MTRRPAIWVIVLAAAAFGLWGVVDFLSSRDTTESPENVTQSVAARGASAASSPPTFDSLLNFEPPLETPVEVLTGPVTSGLSPWARRSARRYDARTLEQPQEASTLEDESQPQEEAQPAGEENTDQDEEEKRPEEEPEQEESNNDESTQESRRSNRDEDANSDGIPGQSTSLTADQLLTNNDNEPSDRKGTPGENGTGNSLSSNIGEGTDGSANESG